MTWSGSTLFLLFPLGVTLNGKQLKEQPKYLSKLIKNDFIVS
jgi:hypothetical protein